MERGHLGLSFQPGNGLLSKFLRSTRGLTSVFTILKACRRDRMVPKKKGGKRKRENKATDCLANQDASINSMAALVMAGTSILPLRHRISWVPCSRYLSP